jgi:prepilin-type processing-associated H-X9-DG protein
LRSTYTYDNGLIIALTSYIGISGKNRSRPTGVLFADSHVRFADITDGTSNTLAVGERPPYPEGGWGTWYTGLYGMPHGNGAVILGVREPCWSGWFPLTRNCGSMVFHFSPGSIDDAWSAYHFWSLHIGGANFLFADGSARFLSYSADDIMPALASRAGGEVVDVP